MKFFNEKKTLPNRSKNTACALSLSLSSTHMCVCVWSEQPQTETRLASTTTQSSSTVKLHDFERIKKQKKISKPTEEFCLLLDSVHFNWKLFFSYFCIKLNLLDDRSDPTLFWHSVFTIQRLHQNHFCYPILILDTDKMQIIPVSSTVVSARQSAAHLMSAAAHKWNKWNNKNN